MHDLRSGCGCGPSSSSARCFVPCGVSERGGNFPPSCDGQADGLRGINPDGTRAFQVFCQAGWVLMQKRTGPSVHFYRNWNSYARGFGDSANLWLGNDNLHALTSAGARLWVSLEDADNNWRYAEYENFFVASALDYYQAIFEGYTGTAGDSLSYHSGQRFSTYDADHDSSSGYNCAELYTGAWWYKSCYDSNLNGKYEHPGLTEDSNGIEWEGWYDEHYSMRLHPHVGASHGVVLVVPSFPLDPVRVLRQSRMLIFTVQIGVITRLVPPGARVQLRTVVAAGAVMVGVVRAKPLAAVIR